MLRTLARNTLLNVRLGRYERENVETLESLVTPGMTCWDIGANIGQIAYVLARLVGPEGHVVAVEPGPKNAHTLRKHARQNVHVLECAVSDTAGYVHFAGDGRSDAMIRDDGAVLVRTTTLDEMLVKHPPPHLVKMDIEGHELPAFRGAARLLAEVHPVLVVEFHGKGLPERDVDSEARALVAHAGYTWAPSEGGWYVAHHRNTRTF